jgi:hypothetical protein
MSDGAGRDGGAAGSFESIDPKLNMFALANGMDLTKEPGQRRLEWFTEGLERAIVVETDGATAFRVSVVSWRHGSKEITGRASVAEAVPAAELMPLLDPAIETANGLGGGG